jgi:hypothetical protein
MNQRDGQKRALSTLLGWDTDTVGSPEEMKRRFAQAREWFAAQYAELQKCPDDLPFGKLIPLLYGVNGTARCVVCGDIPQTIAFNVVVLPHGAPIFYAICKQCCGTEKLGISPTPEAVVDVVIKRIRGALEGPGH